MKPFFKSSVSLGRGFFFGLLTVSVLQLFLSWFINYPPTEEQLPIILRLPTAHQLSFWLVKGASLALVLISLVLFKRILEKFFEKKIAVLSSLVVFLSPTIYATWNLHPVDAVKVVVVMTILWWGVSRGFRSLLIAGATIVVALLMLANNQPLSNIPILNAMSPTAASAEIQDRLYSEASIVNLIHIPLAVKRIAYNKPYFIYKDVVGLFISYADLESLFFQEVNSLGIKSFVLFFWPEIIFLSIGFFYWARDKNNQRRSFVALLVFISFVDFLLLNKPLYQQFLLTLFPLSVLVAIGIKKIARVPILGFLAVSILAFSVWVNYFDIAARPAFWFDNRPLVYRFIFDKLRTVGENSKQIRVTTLVGNSERYCEFYLGSCPPEKYKFDAFDLTATGPVAGTTYAGFLGEFIGKSIKNDFPSDWKDKFSLVGMTIEAEYQTRDTIAYHYGDIAVVAKK